MHPYIYTHTTDRRLNPSWFSSPSVFCLVSISAISKYTSYKTVRRVCTAEKQVSPFHSSHSLSLIAAAGREYFHTFAPQPFLIHKAALFLVHRAVVLYGWWVQIKVRVKFPSEKNTLYKEATASNKLTFTFSYCKILIKKMRSVPQRAPKLCAHTVPIPRTGSVSASVLIKLEYSTIV